MTTETSPLNRQPDKLDYTSPTQFRFMINQLPKVQFFTQTANIPGISLGELVIPTPYKDIPIIGDKVTFENLTISFIVDEFLENLTQDQFAKIRKFFDTMPRLRHEQEVTNPKTGVKSKVTFEGLNDFFGLASPIIA